MAWSYAGFVVGGLRLQVLASISGAEDGAINPAAWVERHARRRPGDPALAEGDRVCASWGEFAARTAGAATGLRDHFGLSPGDRVAIVMRNRPEYLEALFAIWHAGLVAVPVNARLHRDEIAYILEHSESAVTVTDADHAGDVESLVGTVPSLQAAVPQRKLTDDPVAAGRAVTGGSAISQPPWTSTSFAFVAGTLFRAALALVASKSSCMSTMLEIATPTLPPSLCAIGWSASYPIWVGRSNATLSPPWPWARR